MSLPRRCITGEHPLERLLGIRLERKVLFSGGARGADVCFGQHAHAAGFQVIHWSFEAHTAATTDFKVDLSQQLLKRADPYLRSASPSLCKSMPRNAYVKSLLRRNVYQIFYANSVYAIGWLMPATDTGCVLRISGGTLWACQMYVDRFKPKGAESAGRCQLYLFDQSSDCWLQWKSLSSVWQQIEQPPTAEGRCAGIGSRRLTESGKKAIASLFKNKTG